MNGVFCLKVRTAYSASSVGIHTVRQRFPVVASAFSTAYVLSVAPVARFNTIEPKSSIPGTA